MTFHAQASSGCAFEPTPAHTHAAPDQARSPRDLPSICRDLARPHTPAAPDQPDAPFDVIDDALDERKKREVFMEWSLPYDNEVALLGTELVRQLRSEGHKGVCCILTGASDEEIASIKAFPGVDLALPKTTSAKHLAEWCLNCLRAKA